MGTKSLFRKRLADLSSLLRSLVETQEFPEMAFNCAIIHMKIWLLYQLHSPMI